MQSTPEYVIKALTKIEFYCPACGEISVIDIGTRFMLSPGQDRYECPNCETEYTVSVEFQPVLTQEHA